MPNGKKKKGHKMATHKRKKRLRKNVPANPSRIAAHPFELKRNPTRKARSK